MTTSTPVRPTCSHFYRYQSSEHLDRLKIIILEHELYIPSVRELNDPADCRPRLAPLSEDQIVAFLLNDVIRRNPQLPLEDLETRALIIGASIRKHGPEKVLREMAKHLNAEMESFRIYSLSKRFDNLSLWARYAGEHSGYCLEFANEGRLFERAVEVIYGECAPMDVNDPEQRNRLFLAYKRPQWSNEEEVRLIRERGSSSTVKIEPSWLTRLILGMRMSEGNQKSIREWASQRQPKLTVVNAYFDELDQELRLSQ